MSREGGIDESGLNPVYVNNSQIVQNSVFKHFWIHLRWNGANRQLSKYLTSSLLNQAAKC